MPEDVLETIAAGLILAPRPKRALLVLINAAEGEVSLARRNQRGRSEPGSSKSTRGLTSFAQGGDLPGRTTAWEAQHST
eukprot:6192107-Pleurochrysis_carterae.AAC.1